MSDQKIFSPSQTSNWMRCPMYRALRREGWVSKYAKKKDLAAIIGTSFAAGVGVYNNLRKEHEQQALSLDKKAATLAAMGSAFSVLQQQMDQLEASNRIIDLPFNDSMYLQQMRDRVGKGVTNYIKNEPIPPTWRIVDVEREFPEHGKARPDLVVRDDLGLAVVDYKTKVELKAFYVAKTLQEYQNSHQQYHYAWAGEQIYGEPIHRYYIALTIFEPWSVHLVPYEVQPEALALWQQSSAQVWDFMAREDAGETKPFLSDRHADNFGQCDYYNACFKWRYDPELMKQDYINLKELADA